MNIIKKYLNTLKKIETEEVFDIIFYRPIAYVVMKIFYYTPATPNFISTMSILFGLCTGFFYTFHEWKYLLYGSIALALANVFDCADGMLARAKNNGTRFGRVYDGISDYIIYIAAYFGMAYHLFTATGDVFIWPLTSGHWLWWPIVLIAGLSTVFQTITVDGVRNDFVNYTEGSKTDFLNKELAEYTSEYNKIKDKKGHWRLKFLYKLYFSYIKVQMKTASSMADNVTPEEYYRKNKLVVRLFTFLGSTTHITLVIIFSLFKRFDLYMWSLIIPLNIMCVILRMVQKKVNKRRKN